MSYEIDPKFREVWGKLPTFFDYVDREEFKMEHRPLVTVDAIVCDLFGLVSKFLLIKRKNPPEGWALPGGMLDCGETVEQAVVRELKEETSLDAEVEAIEFFCVSSDPKRDPRFHSVSLAYEIIDFIGEAVAADDAKEVGWFTYDEVMSLDIAFDHKDIIKRWWEKQKEIAMNSIDGLWSPNAY